jgi:hypothetical protein
MDGRNLPHVMVTVVLRELCMVFIHTVVDWDVKVFATFMRNKGIEPEIIDLLQGRISRSVFVNHYYRPDINEIITNRIRPVLDNLLKELI